MHSTILSSSKPFILLKAVASPLWIIAGVIGQLEMSRFLNLGPF